MGYYIKKIAVILLILFTAAAGGFFLYKAYHNYRYFHIAKNIDQYIITIEKLNDLMRKVEQERLLSALYLGYEGKTDFNALKTKRVECDKTLSDIAALKIQNRLFNIDTKKLKSDLGYVRSRIDVINGEYEDIFFKYYQKEILKRVIDNINELSNELSSALPTLKSFMDINALLMIYRNSLNMEQSFVVLMLSRAKKVSMNDLVLWENILQKQKFPRIIFPENPDMEAMIKKELQPAKFQKSMRELRAGVLKGVTGGHSFVGVNEWMRSIYEKIKRIEASAEIIMYHLKTKKHQELSSLEMFINILTAIVLFIVSVLLFSLSKKKKRVEKNPDIEIKHKEIEKESVFKKKKSEKIEGLLWDDLPLTNMQRGNDHSFIVQESEPKFSESFDGEITAENRVFHPIEEFKSIIKYFVNRMSDKSIDFSYYIDPSLSYNCVGDIDKIREILSLFLEYSFENTPSKGEVVLKIDSIARKETVTIVNFVIENSGKYINEKLRHEILRDASRYNSRLADLEKSKKRESDLHFAAKLISSLDGNLQIGHSSLKGTHFSVSLNLKRSKA